MVDSAAGKKRGRRPLPEDLPRERVEYDLPDDKKSCPCCQGQMHRMGEAVKGQLHRAWLKASARLGPRDSNGVSSNAPSVHPCPIFSGNVRGETIVRLLVLVVLFFAASDNLASD